MGLIRTNVGHLMNIFATKNAILFIAWIVVKPSNNIKEERRPFRSLQHTSHVAFIR
jgi:hypothetical protein